jgi:hypothetical protein
MKSIDRLKNAGRPLDIARFQYHFEDGDISEVLSELKKFQNSDGGFGHGLELDCRNPNSSPIATWVATEILSELNVWDPQVEIVGDLLTYLSACEQKDDGWFRFSIPSNNEYARAIWWNYDPDKKAGIYNPSAALYGFMAFSADDEYARAKLMKIFDYFLDDGSLDMHDLNALVRGVQYALMANMSVSEKVIEKVRQQITLGCKNFIEGDRTDYVLRPSVFFPNFDFPFFEDLKEELKIESAWLWESVTADGTWPIPWNWYQYEGEFEKIKPEWMSDMIVKNLRLIHRMNREVNDAED